MDPYDVYYRVFYKYTYLHGKFVGHGIIHREFRRTIVTYASLTLWCSAIILAIYTALTSDREVAATNLFFALLGTQGIVKSHCMLSKTKQFHEMLNFLDELYTVNQHNVNYKNYRFLQKCSRLSWFITKFVVIVFCSSFTMVIIAPLPIYLITGNIEPILPIQIPFIDLKTTSGYTIHSTYMIVLVISAYCGTCANELFMIQLTLQIWPMMKIFDRAIKDLNETRTDWRLEAINKSTWLRHSVRNIALMHIKIYSYVADSSNIFYTVFTNEVYTDECSLILLVYVFLVLKWLPAGLFFLLMLVKLLCYCSVGTAVEIMNDQIYNALANMDCVTLPPNEKKMVLLMTHVAQHPATFKAGLVPLNLPTFVKVIQNVYTFGMLLIEFA